MGQEQESRKDGQTHGGDLDRARAIYGGAREEWLDLSTGINSAPYPAAAPPLDSLARLPDRLLTQQAVDAARAAYAAPARASIVAAAGAQPVIDALPRLSPPARAAIVGPTYTEHGIAFRRAGWETVEVDSPNEAGADSASALVIVNPNNPTGRLFEPERLEALIRPDRLLIIDESFADVTPSHSLAPRAGQSGLVILRSFGKFYGLAGLRLGFALCSAELAEKLTVELGPWPVSGPALSIGAGALADHSWRATTRQRLAADRARLDALASRAGWRLIGGCDLFRSYDCGDAGATQSSLAEHKIWTRRFDYAPSWLRLGLPGDATGWARLRDALERLAP
ncbi:MAG: threonine-phosphate decarboxylase CobD [Neomegalonema sp.]|nr:threonine-phosphate decarboxylase CobD [Neomegalonema sp.]